MTNYDFSRNDRIRRRKAMWIAILVHLGLFAGIVFYSSDVSDVVEDYLPQPVKEWLDVEEDLPEMPGKERV